MSANLHIVEGLCFEECIKDVVYIVRGYDKGENYPAEYKYVFTVIVVDGKAEAKGFLSRRNTILKPSDLRVINDYFDSKGFSIREYSRSTGANLRDVKRHD